MQPLPSGLAPGPGLARPPPAEPPRARRPPAGTPPPHRPPPNPRPPGARPLGEHIPGPVCPFARQRSPSALRPRAPPGPQLPSPPPLPAYLRLPKSARTACACALLPARPRCACVRAFIRLCERERAAGRGSAAGRERTVGGAQGRGSTAPPGGVRAPATPPVTPPVTPQSRPSHAPAAPRLSAPTGAYVGARLSLGRGSSPTHSFRPNRGIGICISVRALSRPARPFSPCCPGDTVLEDREARPSSSGLCPGAGRGTE